ncbi:MAG: hypothetical protein LBJ71_00180 [Holosporaceae bacterium]|jgi:hypothetical protein|nr:hypothetical protein [Holosporaceae bacterium]
MRKTIILISGIMLYCASEASLITKEVLEWWKEKEAQDSTITNTCCIFAGKVLLDSEFLIGIRHFFVTKLGNPENPFSVSYADKSTEAIADLVIQFFPSANELFNAEGTSSFSSLGFKTPEVVAFAFEVADAVRNSRENNEYEKFISDILNEKNKIIILNNLNNLKNNAADRVLRCLPKMEESNRKARQIQERQLNALVRLINNIKNAVKKEAGLDSPLAADGGAKYPAYFVNYVIAAYAWSAFNGKDDLNNMHELLKQTNGIKKTKETDSLDFSSLVEVITRETNYLKNLYFPVAPGEVLISNGSTMVDKINFQDCVETAVRQFLAMLLCKRDDESKQPVEGEQNNETKPFTIDLDVLPKNSILYKAFKNAPNEIKEDGIILADRFMNNGSQEVRNWWATSISKINDIIYVRKEEIELKSGFKNALKLICKLLKDNNSPMDLQEIEQDIERNDIEACFKKILSKFNKPNIMIQSKIDNSWNKCYGSITFLQEGNGDINQIELIFKSGHGQMHNRALNKLSNRSFISDEDYKQEVQNSNWLKLEGSPWLKQLYININYAIYGKVHPQKNEKVAVFPFLREIAAVHEAANGSDLRKVLIENEKAASGIVRYLYNIQNFSNCFKTFGNNEEIEKSIEIISNIIHSFIFSPDFMQINARDKKATVELLISSTLDKHGLIINDRVGKIEELTKTENSLIGACILRFLFGKTEVADAVLTNKIKDEKNLLKNQKEFSDSIDILKQIIFSNKVDKIRENLKNTNPQPLDINVIMKMIPSFETLSHSFDEISLLLSQCEIADNLQISFKSHSSGNYYPLFITPLDEKHTKLFFSFQCSL